MKIEELDDWNWPDIHFEPDGYDSKCVPDCSVSNFKRLVEVTNKLVRKVNELEAKLNAKEMEK